MDGQPSVWGSEIQFGVATCASSWQRGDVWDARLPRAFGDRGEPPLTIPCQLLKGGAWSWPGCPQHRQHAGEHVVAVFPQDRHDLAGQRYPVGGCQQPGERLAKLRELLAPGGR